MVVTISLLDDVLDLIIQLVVVTYSSVSELDFVLPEMITTYFLVVARVLVQAQLPEVTISLLDYVLEFVIQAVQIIFLLASVRVLPILLVKETRFLVASLADVIRLVVTIHLLDNVLDFVIPLVATISSLDYAPEWVIQLVPIIFL